MFRSGHWSHLPSMRSSSGGRRWQGWILGSFQRMACDQVISLRPPTGAFLFQRQWSNPATALSSRHPATITAKLAGVVAQRECYSAAVQGNGERSFYARHPVGEWRTDPLSRMPLEHRLQSALKSKCRKASAKSSSSPARPMRFPPECQLVRRYQSHTYDREGTTAQRSNSATCRCRYDFSSVSSLPSWYSSASSATIRL